MKRIIFIAVFMFFLASCGKENILWIGPWVDYKVKLILVKDVNGQEHDILQDLFPGASEVTFTKKWLGELGDGVVKVIRYDYETATYTGYYPQYNASCGCYSYDYYNPYNQYTYTVTWRKAKVNEYHFSWDKASQEEMKVDFSELDPILQGQSPNTESFLKILEQTYTVIIDSRKDKTLVAGVIELRSDAVRIVLERP